MTDTASLQNGCPGDRFVCLVILTRQLYLIFSMSLNTSPRPLIEMREVVKVYSTAAGEFDALKKVNLQVGLGEFVGIIGKSGAGKSTLLNMITGVDQVTSGEVIINSNGSSVSIHRMKEDDIALCQCS